MPACRRENINFDAPPLGTGSFAEVRRGTYEFSSREGPTDVAFKIFRGNIDAGVSRQFRQALFRE